MGVLALTAQERDPCRVGERRQGDQVGNGDGAQRPRRISVECIKAQEAHDVDRGGEQRGRPHRRPPARPQAQEPNQRQQERARWRISTSRAESSGAMP